jgi:hypothetical protein
MSTYKVVRLFFKSDRQTTVKKGLTLEEARAHCSDPETSWKTCTSFAGLKRTRVYGPWFDAFEEE